MTEKKEWKVGDRVAAYNNAYRLIGCIREIHKDGTLMITDDKDGLPSAGWHPKQCRRLTKRPRREFEIACHAPYGVLRIVQFGEPLRHGDVIRVREIKK